MAKVYPGTSAFFANRAGNHDWLTNNNRPILSLVTTAANGDKTYDDLFLNKYEAIKLTARGDRITISFPKDIKQPLFRVLHSVGERQ